MNASQATQQANGNITPRLVTRQEASTKGQGVVAEVADSCMDFDVDPRGGLFTAFYCNKEMGIGLSISRSIVEAHYEEIRASARDGVGTTLTVRLPSIAAGGS